MSPSHPILARARVNPAQPLAWANRVSSEDFYPPSAQNVFGILRETHIPILRLRFAYLYVTLSSRQVQEKGK
jgi:hypothetical protein